MILLNQEFGVFKDIDLSTPDSLPEATIMVAVNRFNAFCTGGAWSAECFNGFWAYSHPITDLDKDQPDRDQARYNGRYFDKEFMEYLETTANQMLLHEIQGDASPFHWVTVSQAENVTAYSNGAKPSYWHWNWTNQAGEVYAVFVVLTSDQYSGTLR